MNNTELKELIEDCCNDIFDRLEPLANVKSRLYESLKPAISVTQCCEELCECADPFEKTIALKCTGCGMLTEDD